MALFLKYYLQFRAISFEREISKLESRRSNEEKGTAATHRTSTSNLSFSVPVQLCPGLVKTLSPKDQPHLIPAIY